MDRETQRRIRVLRRHLAAACDELDALLDPPPQGSVPVHAVVPEATLRRLQAAAKRAGFLGGSVALYIGKVLTGVSKEGVNDDGEEQANP